MIAQLIKIKQVFQAEDTPEVGFTITGELRAIIIGQKLKVGDYETKTIVTEVPRDGLVMTKNSFYTIKEV